jgi:competence ComEA-like helix-hairpin-helix protein
LRDTVTLLVVSAILVACALGLRTARRPGDDGDLPAPADAAVRIDINSSTWQRLTLLPGIGEKTARLIVADREAHGRYTTIEDLSRVRGIGPTVIRRIRPYADCK